jgi:hypothetical protein
MKHDLSKSLLLSALVAVMPICVMAGEAEFKASALSNVKLAMDEGKQGHKDGLIEKAKAAREDTKSMIREKTTITAEHAGLAIRHAVEAAQEDKMEEAMKKLEEAKALLEEKLQKFKDSQG